MHTGDEEAADATTTSSYGKAVMSGVAVPQLVVGTTPMQQGTTSKRYGSELTAADLFYLLHMG